MVRGDSFEKGPIKKVDRRISRPKTEVTVAVPRVGKIAWQIAVLDTPGMPAQVDGNPNLFFRGHFCHDFGRNFRLMANVLSNKVGITHLHKRVVDLVRKQVVDPPLAHLCE